MNGFPRPGDALLDGTCIASVYYDDATVTALVLNPKTPYYTLAVLDIATREASHRETHANIVPAVEAYQQWGGDV